MKPTFKKCLCTSLKKITAALSDINDADYEWRVFLEKTLVEALLDNSQQTEAAACASNLLELIEKHHDSFYDEFFEFMVLFVKLGLSLKL